MRLPSATARSRNVSRAAWLVLLAAVGITMACGGGAERPVAPPHDAAAAAASPSATQTSAVARASGTSAAADFGVRECDEYLQKYTECVTTKVPEQVRAAMMAAIAESKSQWKTVALTPEGRDGLAQACRQAMQAAQASLQAYGCSW
jgi:hypothetical protein